MVLTSTNNLCFEQKHGNYQNFSSENFHFLVIKFAVCLNRHVFVMDSTQDRKHTKPRQHCLANVHSGVFLVLFVLFSRALARSFV